MPLTVKVLSGAASVLFAVGCISIRSWYRRRIVRRAVPAFSGIEKVTSSVIVGQFGERRFRLDFCFPPTASPSRRRDSFMLITVGSGSTVPFKAFRQNFGPVDLNSLVYESSRPERLEQIMHFADIEPLLQSLLQMADSVEVERTVSVRFSPFKNEYVDPSDLTEILSKVSALAAALDEESVRSGASADEVRRARSHFEARLA